jgi:uncharacterized protein (DUF983 family)
MFRKGNKLYSILKGVCPKCHQEGMYMIRNPYILSETLKMHEHCSHCNTKYKIEPSFFYGSMYVSYGVGIAFAIVAFIVSFFFFDSGRNIAFLSIVSTLVISLPIILRLSRNIWINLFMNYDENLTK